MDTEIKEGPNCYENHLRAMSMYWSGFDPVGSYGFASNYSHQSATCPTLSMTIAKQNDEQIVHPFHPCSFVSFAQHFSTLSFNSNNTSSTSSLSSFPVPTKKKPVPVPENLKDEAYRERRMKNNESARKSRELRRQKEESTQIRCDQLLQENHILRAELSLLQNQMEQFRQIFPISFKNPQQNFVSSSSVSGS
ncbi:BZIP transcription factor family protein [Wuchereria bancrofti]|uniref:BZIP transcription factor family protein n=1 Tax=Wuchereria bancrofti TaxID=6293 RepID=J9F1M7_WUCBA|nr:BZIP transcription factor family protein [Wuchereria bancrofti]